MLLENTFFIKETKNKIKNYPKYLFISANETDGVPMAYMEKDHGTLTTDFATIAENIRNNVNEKLYINLNFKNKIKSPEFAVVDFIEADDDLEDETSQDAEIIIGEMEEILRKKTLFTKIDEALDSKDEKMFYLLTKELNT